MRWTLDELARAVGGSYDPASPDRAHGPVTIDSREVAPGAIFVPIEAERDGHQFIAAAVAAGAGAYLYRRGSGSGALPPGATGIAVADTGRALLDLGRAARGRIDGPVVGITGSVGKTSTKDLTAAALGAAFTVTASPRSLNNELGVPLTLANADERTQVAVIEMGARGVGHIALLCGVAAPTVAVVTAVAAAHTELFGGIDQVARAKGELVEALPDDGVAVLNGDDGRVAAMASRTDAEVLTYGTGRVGSGPSPLPDVYAEAIEVDDELRAAYTVRSPWGSGRVSLAVRGAHQVGNSLAALTVALRLGVGVEVAIAALALASPSPWRMELATAPGGARVLNDAYNANPASMAAALQALARIPARRRVAVLGAMAELGPEGPAEHRRIAALAGDLGIDLIAVGTTDYGGRGVADIDAAYTLLGTLGEDSAVLVKASRVAGLERLAARLLATPATPATPAQ